MIVKKELMSLHYAKKKHSAKICTPYVFLESEDEADDSDLCNYNQEQYPVLRDADLQSFAKFINTQTFMKDKIDDSQVGCLLIPAHRIYQIANIITNKERMVMRFLTTYIVQECVVEEDIARVVLQSDKGVISLRYTVEDCPDKPYDNKIAYLIAKILVDYEADEGFKNLSPLRSRIAILKSYYMCICDLNGIGAHINDDAGFALGRVFRRFFGKIDKASIGRILRPLRNDELNKVTSEYYVSELRTDVRIMLLVFNRNVYEVSLKYEYKWKAYVDFSDALFDAYKSNDTYWIFDCPYSEEDIRESKFIERQSEVRKFVLLCDNHVFNEQRYLKVGDVNNVKKLFKKDKDYIFIHPGRYERSYNLYSYIVKKYHSIILRYDKQGPDGFLQALLGRRGLKKVSECCQVYVHELVCSDAGVWSRKMTEENLKIGHLYDCVYIGDSIVIIKLRSDVKYPDREFFHEVIYASSKRKVDYEIMRKHFKKKE